MGIPWWCIRNPWNECVAIDEFGAGTLDGNPADGPSFDGCAAAAIENAEVVQAAVDLQRAAVEFVAAARVNREVGGRVQAVGLRKTTAASRADVLA